jgi:hypothetical protein
MHKHNPNNKKRQSMHKCAAAFVVNVAILKVLIFYQCFKFRLFL